MVNLLNLNFKFKQFFFTFFPFTSLSKNRLNTVALYTMSKATNLGRSFKCFVSATWISHQLLYMSCLLHSIELFKRKIGSKFFALLPTCKLSTNSKITGRRTNPTILCSTTTSSHNTTCFLSSGKI